MSKKPKAHSRKLSEIASIQTGFRVLSRQTFEEPCFTYTQYTPPSWEGDSPVLRYSDPVDPLYLTEQGDILVPCSTPGEALLVDEEHTGLLIPEQFLIIRCNKEKACPAYIHAQLISDRGRADCRRLCRDAVLPRQKAQKYGEWKTALPSLEEQEMFLSISRDLSNLQEEIARRITESMRKRWSSTTLLFRPETSDKQYLYLPAAYSPSDETDEDLPDFP